ncbi:MAG: hypothetical protein RMM08_02805 [Armatimonadota bacterium]|nr:hypothetical protein [bacterium]MDW8320269.1 hypothetical protein [Armatimonadota bacterium]
MVYRVLVVSSTCKVSGNRTQSATLRQRHAQVQGVKHERFGFAQVGQMPTQGVSVSGDKHIPGRLGIDR